MKEANRSWSFAYSCYLYSDIDSLLLYAGTHRLIFGFHRALSNALPDRTILTICYAAELRVSEAICLKVTDTRFERDQDPQTAAEAEHQLQTG